MSSYDGGGFDEWLEDSFFSDIAPDRWTAIRAIMAPHKERVEISLEGFEPDEMSWRQFRNDLWHSYEAESAKIQAVLSGVLKPEDVLGTSSRPEEHYGKLVMGLA